MDFILVIHIFSTFYMAGLCWFVQIAHYPLFKAIKHEDFPAYERKNMVTGYVTAPIMTIEIFTGLWLLYQSYNSFWIMASALLLILWLSTFFLQVPIHLKLMNRATDELINKVIWTNWIRTLAWTIRSAMFMYLMLNWGLNE